MEQLLPCALKFRHVLCAPGSFEQRLLDFFAASPARPAACACYTVRLRGDPPPARTRIRTHVHARAVCTQSSVKKTHLFLTIALLKLCGARVFIFIYFFRIIKHLMLLYDHFITAVLLHVCDRAASPNVKLIFFFSEFNPSHKMIHFILFMHLIKKNIYSDIVRNENFSALLLVAILHSCAPSFVSRCFRAPPAVRFIHVFPRTCW